MMHLAKKSLLSTVKKFCYFANKEFVNISIDSENKGLFYVIKLVNHNKSFLVKNWTDINPYFIPGECNGTSLSARYGKYSQCNCSLLRVWPV